MPTCATRRDFLKTVAASSGLLLADRRTWAEANASKPNFVLIYADDLDFDELGVYDPAKHPCRTGLVLKNAAGADSRMLMPHIDGLARDGALFTRFYITSPVCTPSRYSILTGRLASRSPDLQDLYPPGTQANIQWNTTLRPHESNIAKALGACGYATGVIGKWHNFPNHRELRGRGIPENGDPRDPSISQKLRAQYEKARASIRACGFDYVERIHIGNTEKIKPKAIRGHNLEWLVEGALDFLDKHHHRPFFLYMPITVPHGGYPPNCFKRLNPFATTAGLLKKAPKVQPSRESVIERLRAAGIDERNAMGTWMDDSVGAVLKKLDDLGVSDNTMVIFVSDHQSRGKYTCYEGARVPAIVRWPGRIQPGTRIDSLCANIDIPATLTEAAGGTLPEDMAKDGQSFLPMLLGRPKPQDWRRSLLLEIANIRAVVTARWKYIANRVPEPIRERMTADAAEAARAGRRRTVGWDGRGSPKAGKRGGVRYSADVTFPSYFDEDQLYDLVSDVYEQRNLASDFRHASTLQQMKQLMRDHLSSLPHAFGEFTAK